MKYITSLVLSTLLVGCGGESGSTPKAPSQDLPINGEISQSQLLASAKPSNGYSQMTIEDNADLHLVLSDQFTLSSQNGLPHKLIVSGKLTISN